MLDESEAESDGSAPYFDDFSDPDDLFEPESPRSYFSFDEMDDIPSSLSFLEVDSSGDSDFFDIGNTSDNSNLKIHSVDEETPRSAHYIDLDNDMFNGNMQRIQELTLILPNAPDDDAAYTSLDVDQLAAAARPSDDEVDLYDSGATRHMSGFKHRFINFVKTEDVPITAADKRTFKAIGKGDMYIYLPNGAKQMSRVLLKTVLYAPLMGITLVSISRITSTGSTVIFTKDVCQIYNRERQMIGEIKVKGGLYRVHASSFKDEAHAINTQNLLSIYELHRRLGHISYDRVKLLMSKKLVSGVELDASVETTVCESCEWAKGERKQMSKVREGERHTAVGDEVHSDLWGPAPVETISRKKYYISFTDDHSRYTNVYFLLTKDKAFNFYQAYEAWLSTQHNTRIKCLRSDRGGEYLSTEFSDHLKKAGTVRRLTVHDTPEHNGVAEHLNRTILEKVRAMLHESGLPKFLWAEATAHAVYLKNCTWTHTLGNTTPYEILNGSKPNLANLQPWGCKVRIHDMSGSKLDGHSKIGRWMGFDVETRDGHCVYWPEKRTVTVERSVRFNFNEEESSVKVLPLEGETEHNEQPSTSQSAPETPAVENELISDTPDENPTQVDEGEPIQPTEGRGKRVRRETDYIWMLREGTGVTGERRGDPLPRGMQTGSTPGDVGDLAVEEYAMATVIESAEGLTPTYEEARKRSDWPKWKDAIQNELESLKKSHTWELTERPKNANIVDCQWVLRIKKDATGEIEKYKAHLVAKGFTQIYGIDYYETYAPVARLSSIRLLLTIAARNGWKADTFDFDSAYLNSPLGENEVIYLEQPIGHEPKDRRHWVWKLLKTLYGLKQGARNWYEALFQALVELGFTRTEVDHGVFFKREGDNVIILAVHVDDCLVTGSPTTFVNKFKVDMHKKYKLTDLGPANWLLGIKITRDRANKTISLSQHAYIESIITQYNFDDLKPLSIPMDPSAPLSKSQSPNKLEDIARMKNTPYREAVGSLMYAAMGTRPDIAFATSTVAQFSDNPGWPHWEAVKRIFRYLLGTKKLELTYGGEERGLVGYVDADGASQEHRRAISGYVFMVDGGAVSWSSKKQELVTLSTTEAEYVAATHTAKEAVWLRRLITELFGSIETPTTLFSDSKSAIALAKDGHYHACTKHIDIRYHFIRYIVEAGTIKLVYCPTDDMTADTLSEFSL